MFLTIGPYDLAVWFSCETAEQAAGAALGIHTLLSAQTVTMSVISSQDAGSATLRGGVLAATDLHASGHDEVARRVLAAAEQQAIASDHHASGHDDLPGAGTSKSA